ncbi:MAG TPA: arylsulfatase [Cyclobacteriaceae bacterium]|nr:arylsulfatase [Cyclobacteriaceae bacterium]
MKSSFDSVKLSFLSMICFVHITSAQKVLPVPQEPFSGKISISPKESIKDFPKEPHAPKDAPNVFLVLLDDVGFGASSTFGGYAHTPTLQRLADNGLKYNRFHTTAVCSPTRAALLTGKNSHQAHSGVVTEMANGFPGYHSLIGKENATVAEILKQNGYNTAWIGKNHNVPDWHSSAAGPFDIWPTGLGFEKFYGFIGGEANQFRPLLFDGITPIEPYLGKPDYNLDYDLADQASNWIKMQKASAPDKPFFCYYAPGATHAPHHATKEWIGKQKGKFDMGWDKLREMTFERQKKMGIIPADAKLTPRDPSLPAWDSMDPKYKEMYSYMMEIYAAYLEQADYNVGRVLQAIEDMGQLENTLVIYIVGDNGAASEGGIHGKYNDLTILSMIDENPDAILSHIDELGTWKSNNSVPAGWGWASNTPFQWVKQIASHFGGTRNAMVISWPKGIKAKGEMRSQFHHVSDIVPTILEAAGIEQPAIVNGVGQKPMSGISMKYTFDSAKAEDRRTTQYFEIFGNAGLYHEGWMANTKVFVDPWSGKSVEVDWMKDVQWELYNIEKDFSQSEDLAASNPEKLAEMKNLFFAEAAKNDALPIDNSKAARFATENRPSLTRGRTSFTYYQGMKRIPEGAAPEIKNISWQLTAELDLKDDKTSGMIVTQGGLFGGWALYMAKGKPVFCYNHAAQKEYYIQSDSSIKPGKHKLVMDFKYDGGGMGKGGNVTLTLDGQEIARGRVDATVPLRFSTEETFDVGEDTSTPVNLKYDVPFKFSGIIDKVVVEYK